MEWTIGKIARKIASLFTENPTRGFSYIIAVIRGSCYIAYYGCFRKNVRIAFPFLAFTRVRIIGPGKVTIAKGCHVLKVVFKGLTIITYSENSAVEIGERCMLGGITIRSRKRVEIGSRTVMAMNLVQDAVFPYPIPDESRTDGFRLSETCPVIIGGNVWLGTYSIVLGGCRIGDDSVLSAGTMCYGMTIPDYSLVAGNPAKKPLRIDNLLRLKRMS